jgi:two-component system sensor histidine kinase AlgZ
MEAPAPAARGATPVRADARAESPPDDFFIPDFCATRMVFAVVLIAELVAVTLSLARPGDAFLSELGRVSMFLQWLALTSAAVLCYARPLLPRLRTAGVTAVVVGLLMANTALVSAAALWFGDTSGGADFFPRDAWPFLLRNEGICVIVTAMLLRYFFVEHQWRRQVRAEARSRLEALQARIRPHFLFNSLNTIAALTRSDAARAEEAVEDLADLFRATLRDTQTRPRLREELELTRMYQRIEQLRLGERLQVRWDVTGVPMDARVPGLTLQPLLENAIYHGIEPLEQGGTVTIEGRMVDGKIEIAVTNPVGAVRAEPVERQGNRIALDNIRQRLALAYGADGALDIAPSAESFRVAVRFPYEQ